MVELGKQGRTTFGVVFNETLHPEKASELALVQRIYYAKVGGLMKQGFLDETTEIANAAFWIERFLVSGRSEPEAKG